MTNKNKILGFITLASIIVLGGLGLYYFATHKSENKFGQVFGQNNDIYTPYKLEGFGNGWITTTEYDGTNLPDSSLVEAKNIDFGTKNSIAPRRGSKILGTESTETSPIYSMHTSKSLEGREVLIITSTTTVQWWNADGSSWEYLQNNVTANLEHSFADGNDSNESEVYTYIANGTDSIKRFRLAFGSISSNTSTEIILNPVSGFSNANEIGFATSTESSTDRTITINGINYTYDNISGWNLQGLSALPTFSEDEGVIGAISSTGFVSAPASANALVIKDQRLYAAYKNSVFCSKIDALQDFSYSAPRVGGEGEIVFFPDGGQKVNALGVRPNYVAVFKDDYIGSIEFTDISTDLTDIPTIKTIARGIDIGATSQKAVANLGFEVIFANNDIGMTSLTRLQNTDYDQAVSFTELVRPTLDDYNFTSNSLIVHENIVLNSARDSSSDFNNRIIMYDVTEKRLTELHGWNANAFAVYNDKIYYGDALTKNVYETFYSEYDDNSFPYSTNFKTKWFNFGEPTLWKELGWVFIEGWINQATTLTFKINLDEGGTLSSKTITISGTGSYVSSVSGKGFSINPFGLNNFSDISGSSDNLLHFSGWINTGDITQHKFRNIQFEGSTDGVGQNYRISKIIPYWHALDEQWSRSYDSNIISN